MLCIQNEAGYHCKACKCEMNDKGHKEMQIKKIVFKLKRKEKIKCLC